MDFDDLIKKIEEMPQEPFKPHAWYNADGRMVEACWSNESHYAEWINPQITLLRSQADPTKVVGVLLSKIEGLEPK